MTTAINMKKYLLSLALASLALGISSACTPSTAKAESQQGQSSKASASPIKTIDAKYMREHIFDYRENPTRFVFKGKKPAILDFYADWCGPCRQLSPRLVEIAKKYEGQVDVYKINIDNEEELAKVFGVRSIPMLLFIPMDETPIQHSGALSIEQLDQAVQQIIK